MLLRHLVKQLCLLFLLIASFFLQCSLLNEKHIAILIPYSHKMLSLMYIFLACLLFLCILLLVYLHVVFGTFAQALILLRVHFLILHSFFYVIIQLMKVYEDFHFKIPFQAKQKFFF